MCVHLYTFAYIYICMYIYVCVYACMHAELNACAALTCAWCNFVRPHLEDFLGPLDISSLEGEGVLTSQYVAPWINIRT